MVFILIGFWSRNYWSSINHPLMANIWEIATLILARNLNAGLSYLITTVQLLKSIFLSKVASKPKNFIIAPSKSDNLINPSWSSIQMDLCFGVQPKRFVSTACLSKIHNDFWKLNIKVLLVLKLSLYIKIIILKTKKEMLKEYTFFYNMHKICSQKNLLRKYLIKNKTQQENLSMKNIFYWAQKKNLNLKFKKYFYLHIKNRERKKSQKELFFEKWKWKSHKNLYCISIFMEN